MKTGKNEERIYELLEQFNFRELSAEDKRLVLSEMSETEYNRMRHTIIDTECFYSSSIGPEEEEFSSEKFNRKQDKEILIIKLLKYPVQLYKVAATVLVVFGIYAIIQYSGMSKRNNQLASLDTVYIHKTDTIYSKIIDTVKIITEKIISEPHKPNKLIAQNNVYVPNKEIDYSRELCPKDIDMIKEMSFNSDLSNDSSLKDFVVAIK